MTVGERRIAAKRTVLTVFVAILVGGCLPVADDPDGRERVVELALTGDLEPTEGFEVYRVPDDLAGTSQGGEVVVTSVEGVTYVVFFDVRGLNHYTGWVFTSSGQVTEDPLGNHPFQAREIAPGWFRVDAG